MTRANTSLLVLALAILPAAASARPDAGGSASPNGDAAGEAASSEPASAGDEAVTEARDAFRRGSALARSGDWEGALVAFEQSEQRRPHPVTLYDIAYCERALGHYARASFRFAEALAAPSNGDASLPDDLTRDATTYLEEVRGRVARVTVARRPADLTLRVDGKSLERMQPSDRAVYGVAARRSAAEPPPGPFELWLDPGTHVFVSSGPGDARSVESRTFTAGENGTLMLSLPEKTPPSALPRPPPSSPPPAHDALREPAPPNRTAAFVSYGVASVGLAGSILFGALALSEKHALAADGCIEKRCPPQYAGRESRMVTFADLATAGLVTLGVGAAVGTYFLVTATPSKSKSARVVPWFTGTAAGLSGRF